jgi:hypothetical protein
MLQQHGKNLHLLVGQLPAGEAALLSYRQLAAYQLHFNVTSQQPSSGLWPL